MAAILTVRPDPASPRAQPEATRRLVLLDGGRSPDRLAATYRRRRLGAMTLAVVVLVGAAAGARVALATVTPSRVISAPAPVPVPAGMPTVAVRPGDTLWSIARRVQPRGDVRALVDRLSAAHGPAALQPGDRVAIPAA